MFKGRIIAVCLALPVSSSSLGQLPGFEIVQITNTPGSQSIERHPRMNDCGEIVYSLDVHLQEHLNEIYLYDNGKITRLTNNFGWDRSPDINEAGVMTWVQNSDGFGGGTIIKYEDGNITEISSPGQIPTINDSGQIAWGRRWHDGCAAADADIMMFDGQAVVMVSEGARSNALACINNAGEVTWTRYDFCFNPWESDIMLGFGGEMIECTGDHHQAQLSMMNNHGVVVWDTPDEVDPNVDWVDVWENGVVTRITRGASPRINDLGQIAINVRDLETGFWHPWLYEAGDLIQITDDEIGSSIQDMNEFTEIVMLTGTTFDRELRLHRRIRTGDGDFDGVIDLGDHADLVDCFTGPIDTDRLCACRFFDLDHDRDVDLSDYRQFQSKFQP